MLTGRRVNYKKEFALKSGDYVEARDPNVVSNSMEPRNQACIALFPTASINGSWKMLNIETKKIVSRSVFKKPLITHSYVIEVMNSLAAGSAVEPEHIDSTGVTEDDAGVIDFEIEEDEVAKVHSPDPNVIEVLGAMQEAEEEADLNSDEEASKPMAGANETVRRSGRATAGQTTKYQDYVRPDGISGFTSKWGLALAHLSVKVARERFGEKAFEAAKEELVQLIVKKRALRALKWTTIKPFFDHAKKSAILMSHMFYKEKYDGAGVFEKIKG